MPYYEMEKETISPLAKALIAYRHAQNLSQNELAEQLKGAGITYNQIQGWEGGRREAKGSDIVKLSKELNLSCDYLLRGHKTKLIGIHNLTGLSDSSIENLSRICKAHSKKATEKYFNEQENEYYPLYTYSPHLLPLLDSLLSNERVLYALSDVQSLIEAEIRRQTDSEGCESPEDRYAPEAIEYMLSQTIIKAVRQYADKIIDAEVKKMRKEELIKDFAELQSPSEK